jgi:hypothetical protein
LVPEISEENQDIGDAMATKSDDGSEDDEEDRRTVRGVIVDTESESEGKKVMNGHGHGVEEKLVDGKISLHSPQTASQVS